MKKIFLLFLLSFHVSLNAAEANDFQPEADPYADSHMICIVEPHTKQTVACLLEGLQQEIYDFLETQKIDRIIYKQLLKNQKKGAYAFRIHKAQEERLHPGIKIKYPYRAHVSQPLIMKILKDRLSATREFTNAKITTILEYYEVTDQLAIPLEILSEALQDEEEALDAMLKEERIFYETLSAPPCSQPTALELPVDPSTGCVHVPIPPLPLSNTRICKRIKVRQAESILEI